MLLLINIGFVSVDTINLLDLFFFSLHFLAMKDYLVSVIKLNHKAPCSLKQIY